MKKILIASILAAGFAATAIASPPVPMVPNMAGVSGQSSVMSGSASMAASTGNGSSQSWANNQSGSFANIKAGSTGGYSATGTPSKPIYGVNGSTSISADVGTYSNSNAGNVSSGTGTGGAIAGGVAHASASGSGYFVGGVAPLTGVIGGAAIGAVDSKSVGVVIAGRNDVGHVYEENQSGFEAGASADSAKSFKYVVVPTGTANHAASFANTYSSSWETKTGDATNIGFNTGVAGAAAGSFANGKTSVGLPTQNVPSGVCQGGGGLNCGIGHGGDGGNGTGDEGGGND